MEVDHFPVLKSEVLKHLIHNPSGFYIDCTFGRGGHSRAILRHLDSNGTLLGIDIDLNSELIGEELSQSDKRFNFLPLNYKFLDNYLKSSNLPKADGLLFDLGLSTFQLNDPNRTFSYNSPSSALELRYGVDGKSVYKILNTYSARKLNYIFKKYGELREAERISEAILKARKEAPIKELQQLKIAVERAGILNTRRNKNPLKLVFQALRIEVNSELETLKLTLQNIHELLKKEGKLLIITFHSLEDELILNWKKECTKPLKIPEIGEIIEPLFKQIPSLPILPSREEIELNWPSRSAKLWVFKKLREI